MTSIHLSPLVKNHIHPKADMIFFQADSKSELNRVSEVAKTLEQNGSLWIIYPKGQKDLKQNDVFKAGKSAGLVDVQVVSLFFYPHWIEIRYPRFEADLISRSKIELAFCQQIHSQV